MVSELVVSLRDDDGHILIPGFYADVVPVSDADKAALADLPGNELALRRSLGSRANDRAAALSRWLPWPNLERAGDPRGG